MENEEENEKEEEQHEPQITSDDPAERKLARTLRIQRRAAALKKQREKALSENQAELVSVIQKTPIEIQLEKSSDILEKLAIEGEEHLTNVKIANEAREVDRREREGIAKEKLISQLEEEASAAEQMFNDIASKWSGILKYNDPLHISEDIQNQQEKCNDLIKEKDKIIAELREKLRKAEIGFNIDQRKQIEDINSLAKRIENQIIIMRKAFRQELQLIEEVVMAERQLLMEANNKKWDELAKKRDQEEKSNAEKKTEEYWNFVREMEILDRNFKELYRATNIKLENECNFLQREFERVKTEAVMNSEKLDYNYQILKKREDENLIIRSQQKRRINKLQDIVNNLRKKMRTYHQQTTIQIQKLIEEIKRLQKNILDIEAKADILAKANDSKFNQIWNMNKIRANELLDRILEIDRVLYEQQLGCVWTRPGKRLVKKEDLLSFKNAVSVLNIIENKEKTDNKQAMLAIEEGEKSNLTTEEIKNYKRILRKILTMVADKTGFLIEDQLNGILEPYLEEEKTLVKVDNVFSALCVKEKDDIDILLKYFLPYMFCPICTTQRSVIEESLMRIQDMSKVSIMELTSANKMRSDDTVKEILMEMLGSDADFSGSVIEFGPLAVTLFDNDLEGEARGPKILWEDKGKEVSQTASTTSVNRRINCQYQHPLMVNSIYVLKALKDFLATYHTAKASMPTMAVRLAHKRNTLTRLISTEDIEIFWRKYKEVFPGDREKLWDTLLEGLKRYHNLLKDRKSACEEVAVLRRQNFELRRIFANYIRKNPLQYNK